VRIGNVLSIRAIVLNRTIAGSACVVSLLLAGCGQTTLRNAELGPRPVIGPLTLTAPALEGLAPPPHPITVAVYDFPDLTGQRRPGGVVADLSTAVTQGASSLVIEALKFAGGGAWFDVVDRTRDADQARERQILTDNETAKELKLVAGVASNGKKPADPETNNGNKEADAKSKKSNSTIKPLRPADYIINGGVISFERSVLTNNASGAFLGLGGGGSRNRNFVSITMRLVKAQTSEVVQSITVHKSIDSIAAGIFSKNRINPTGQYPDLLLLRYPSLSDALDADFSGTIAELGEVALREAIEAAITDLICRGMERGIWRSEHTSMALASRGSLRSDADTRGNSGEGTGSTPSKDRRVAAAESPDSLPTMEPVPTPRKKSKFAAAATDRITPAGLEGALRPSF
jgi:curli production assembly/transport component CsgG